MKVKELSRGSKRRGGNESKGMEKEVSKGRNGIGRVRGGKAGRKGERNRRKRRQDDTID